MSNEIGIKDKNGKPICVGDSVKGLFLFGKQVVGTCKYNESVAAYGLEWQRGDVVEFTPFACMCNVEYEVVEQPKDAKEERIIKIFGEKAKEARMVDLEDCGFCRYAVDKKGYDLKMAGDATTNVYKGDERLLGINISGWGSDDISVFFSDIEDETLDLIEEAINESVLKIKAFYKATNKGWEEV